MRPNAKSLQRVRSINPTLAERYLIDARRTYEFDRKKYFPNSNLPSVENVAILYVNSKKLAQYVGESEGCRGCYLGDGCEDFATILLNEDEPEDQTHMTQIHEMAHMAVEIKWKRNMGHGKIWMAEMRRVAALGAFDRDW